MKNLEITTTMCRDTLVVRISGHLDAHSYEEVSGIIRTATDKHHPEKVSVDLTEVRYITSAGISILINIEADEVKVRAIGDVYTTIALVAPYLLIVSPRHKRRRVAA